MIVEYHRPETLQAALELLDISKSMYKEVGANPTLAQLADKDSPLSVFWRRHAKPEAPAPRPTTHAWRACSWRSYQVVTQGRPTAAHRTTTRAAWPGSSAMAAHGRGPLVARRPTLLAVCRILSAVAQRLSSHDLRFTAIWAHSDPHRIPKGPGSGPSFTRVSRSSDPPPSRAGPGKPRRHVRAAPIPGPPAPRRGACR